MKYEHILNRWKQEFAELEAVQPGEAEKVRSWLSNLPPWDGVCRLERGCTCGMPECNGTLYRPVYSREVFPCPLPAARFGAEFGKYGQDGGLIFRIEMACANASGGFEPLENKGCGVVSVFLQSRPALCISSSCALNSMMRSMGVPFSEI